MNKEKHEIIDDAGNTVVIRDGIKIAFNARGGIDVYGSVPVTLHAPVNDTARPQPKTALRPGDRMEDGTIYAGTSPDTGKPMYTTPADAPMRMKWREAMKYAARLEAHSHKDWRLPSKDELNVLFNNRAAIGEFDVNGGKSSLFDGHYWSSSEGDYGTAGNQRFSDGDQVNYVKDAGLSARCVRG